jgi:ribonuclease E
VEPVAPLEQPEAPRDTGPKVVTRTRRRAASRPAGPPTATLPTTAPATESTESTAGQPASALDQVTPLAGVGSPPETGLVEPGTADVEPGLESADQPAPEIEHVPVKKKGSRKR